MADISLLKDIPSLGALFEKPYMEFEYKGVMYRIEELAGGHNGLTTGANKAAVACEKHPPIWDEVRKVWVVPLENHIIDIDLTKQKELKGNIPDESPLRKLRIRSNRSPGKKTKGILITSGKDKNDGPEFPVDCQFDVFIEAKIPGLPALHNVKPFRLLARGLDQWPPLAGTTYENLDNVELYPAIIPFADRIMKPIVRIPRGDKTILTEVFEIQNNDRVILSKLRQ